MPAAFRDEELRRYSRQMLLAEVGGAGQARLRAARVAVVGAGGLGSPAALYLAGAGVGTLTLFDPDLVELSNLPRQILFDTKDLDRAKVEVGRGRLEALNPDAVVTGCRVRLDGANARRLLAGHHVVAEGSDDLATKLLVSDAGVALGIPVVVAAVAGWEGQLLVVRPGRTACYRCVVRRPAAAGAVPSCLEAGILGPVAGVMGSLQALETLKLCLEVPEEGPGGLRLFDGRTGETTTIGVRRDPDCPACGRAAGPDRGGA